MWDQMPRTVAAEAPQSPPRRCARSSFRAATLPPSPAIGERADTELRTVTVAPKNVSGFRLPPSTLLHRSDDPSPVREDDLRATAQALVEKCAEFDVLGQVVQINPGPVVTTFEFRPDAGIKCSRVTALAEDLCLATKAESILIERMAGKNTVGIQVPNYERETIWLRDVIESESFATSRSKLTLSMGKDINGRIVVADLATMPHVLIAGSTGSGKSVAINAMIMSLLYKATPEQVRLILVDPKRVELGMYEGIPHLFTPIIAEPKLAANALRNAVVEMVRRLKLLASRSVRNIEQYNRLFEGATPSLFDDAKDEQPLPYIVIIIDELADLMMVDKANVEESVTRLAQMARAVGIHLVLATQRPSVDVITGLIKANVPSRISFRLATKVDSRTILDSNGAEALLGRGDMLFLPPATSRLHRVHAPLVTEKEIAAVTDFWKSQGQAEYVEAFLEAPKDAGSSESGIEERRGRRRQRRSFRRCRPPRPRIRQGLDLAPAAQAAHWIWPRRPLDRHDGARRHRRPRRRGLQTPRNPQAARLAQRSRADAALAESTGSPEVIKVACHVSILRHGISRPTARKSEGARLQPCRTMLQKIVWASAPEGTYQAFGSLSPCSPPPPPAAPPPAPAPPTTAPDASP